jgi:hypothetical protein
MATIMKASSYFRWINKRENMASVKMLVQDSYWLRAEGLVRPYSGAVGRGNEKPIQQ